LSTFVVQRVDDCRDGESSRRARRVGEGASDGVRRVEKVRCGGGEGVGGVGVHFRLSDIHRGMSPSTTPREQKMLEGHLPRVIHHQGREGVGGVGVHFGLSERVKVDIRLPGKGNSSTHGARA